MTGVQTCALLILGDFPSSRWDQASRADVMNALSRKSSLERPNAEMEEWSYLLPDPIILPFTLSFRTADQDLGLLRIVGFADHPPGVKLQYKLVAPAMSAGDPFNLPGRSGPALSD